MNKEDLFMITDKLDIYLTENGSSHFKHSIQ